ncbi:MAG TPA: hypothetical protein VGR67_05220 [Candidatus Polarisedimenticolia bacterium]|nr:hypothetical protein [Candidatus Polarisedimenticolia bacterium]
MHRHRPAFSALLALLLLSAPALSAAPPAAPADPVMTIGELALLVACLAEPDPARRGAMTSSAAVASLRRAGLELHGEPADPLTEGEMSAFLRQVGITLLTAHPESPLSSSKTAAILSTFGSLLALRAADPRMALASINLGNPIGPEDFSDCAALPTVPECRACCSSLSGLPNNACGKACGRAHAAQQVSASEPTP